METATGAEADIEARMNHDTASEQSNAVGTLTVSAARLAVCDEHNLRSCHSSKDVSKEAPNPPVSDDVALLRYLLTVARG